MIAALVYKAIIITSFTNLGPIAELEDSLIESKLHLEGNSTITYKLRKKPKLPKVNRILMFSHKESKTPAINSMIQQLKETTRGICQIEDRPHKIVRKKRQVLITAAVTLVAYSAAKSIINVLFKPILNSPEEQLLHNQQIAMEHTNRAMEHLKQANMEYNKLVGINYSLWGFSMALNVVTNSIRDILQPGHTTGIGQKLLHKAYKQIGTSEHIFPHRGHYLTHIRRQDGESCKHTRIYNTINTMSYLKVNITILDNVRFIHHKNGLDECKQTQKFKKEQQNILIDWPVATIYKKQTLCTKNKDNCKQDLSSAARGCKNELDIDIIKETLIIRSPRVNMTIHCMNETHNSQPRKYTNVILYHFCTYILSTEETEIHINKITDDEDNKAFSNPLGLGKLSAVYNMIYDDQHMQFELYKEEPKEGFKGYIIASVVLNIILATMVTTAIGAVLVRSKLWSKVKLNDL